MNENDIDYIRNRNQIQIIEQIIDNSYRKNNVHDEDKVKKQTKKEI